ncbi:MAG TPA: sigma-70 family RNA polymerase sigma factor [Steroidobacteraceae bacterium]|nr:sigma-70 family RNA polymerase sigma factor [Steroidobacteraceae bacterium]
MVETKIADRPQPQREPRPGDRADVSKSAIEALIRENYSGLRLLIARRTGDPDVAADLLGEAICIAWEKWQAGKVERPEQIAGYIFQVAINLLRNHRRTVAGRPGARADSSQLDTIADESAAKDDWMERQMAARVKRIIAAMSTPRDRQILTRFYLEEEDKESICRDLNLDAAQFDKVLHRARGRLKDLLEAQGLRKSDFLSVLVLL